MRPGIVPARHGQRAQRGAAREDQRLGEREQRDRGQVETQVVARRRVAALDR
jgi:hypothetical protein